MPLTVDYYFAPNSPWTTSGHRRFHEIAKAAGRAIRGAAGGPGRQGLPVTGGLPLAKRAPQRQAYRLWS
jgi:2-hydroxychromene-2-carboxylate isomerase